MGNIWIVFSCLALLGLQLCGSSPYNDGASPEASTSFPWGGTNGILASIALLVTLVVAFSACLCCYRKKDFSMFTNAPSSNSGSDVPEVLIPIEQQFSPLSIEASSLSDSPERGVLYSVNNPHMLDQRAHVPQNNNIQEDNNNGPISVHELENIENNNAAVYIISENENRNNLGEAIRTREMAIVRLTASPDSVVQFEPLPPNITPSEPTSPSDICPTLQNIAEVDQQQVEIVVNNFEDRWHHMKPNTIPKVDHVTTLPAPTPQAGILSASASLYSREPSTSNLETSKEKASSMTSSIISDKDAPVIETIKSDSLTNLHGSLEDVRGHSRTSDVDIQSQEEITLLSYPLADEAISEIGYVSPNRLLLSDAQNLDPWLKDVVADAQDDMSYYQDVSDAIQNLDNILNSEKTSSSGSSHQASPSKDVVISNGETEMKLSGLVKSPGISNFQSIIEVFPEVDVDNLQQLNRTKSSIHFNELTGLEVVVDADEKKVCDCDSAANEEIHRSEASSVHRKCLLESGLLESSTGGRNLVDNSCSVKIRSNESSALSGECVGRDIVRDISVPSLQDLCNKVRCSLGEVETLVSENFDCNIKVAPENLEECSSSQNTNNLQLICPTEMENELELERNNPTSSFVPEVGLNVISQNTASDISHKACKSDENELSLTTNLASHREYDTCSDDTQSDQYQSNKYDTSDENRLFIKSNSSEYMEIESPLRPSLVNTFEKLLNESSLTCDECGKNLTSLSYQDVSANKCMFPPPESHPNLSPTSDRIVPKLHLPLSLNGDDRKNNMNDEILSTSTPRPNNDTLLSKSAGPQPVIANEIVDNDMLSISSIRANSVDRMNLTADNKISLGKLRYCKDCLTTVQKLELTSKEHPAGKSSSVIIGPFENCTLDLYTGLKTHLPGEDVRFEDELIPEGELLAFSSTFNDVEEPCDEKISPENTYSQRPLTTANNNQITDLSLETWDRFLGYSLQEVSEENNFDSIFSNKPEEKKDTDKILPSPLSAVDDNANLCVAGPSSDNSEQLQLRANAEAESRRRRQLMDFNSDLTTKLAIAENENNINIEYSGPVLVEESIVNDLGDYSTDSNEEVVTEMVRVQLETPNNNSEGTSLKNSDLNKRIEDSYEEDDDTFIYDVIDVMENEEDRAETELESLKALRDELELKLPIAQACRPAMEDVVLVQECEPSEEADAGSDGPEQAGSSGARPGEMLISYQVPLSPIVEETCSEVTAYENDKIWYLSQHTDSSETYPEADYNLTDEICDLVLTLGSERSVRTPTESAGNRSDSATDVDKTYVINDNDNDTQPITREMTMSADSLSGNGEDATLRDSPTNSIDVSLARDELTHTLHDQRELHTHTICSDKIGNENTLSPIQYQQLSQVSQPSAFDNILIDETTQESAITGVNVDLNLKLVTTLSEVSKPSLVSDLQSPKVRTSKATSMDSWCSNDTLFNVEEDFEDFTCTPNTTPIPGDFVRVVTSANDFYSNIPRHDSNSISPDSISDNRTYTNKTSVPHSISTCTADAFIQTHVLDKRPSVELIRHSPCPESIIEAFIPNIPNTTANEMENVLENSKISLQMTKLDSVDFGCLDKSDEADMSMSKSGDDEECEKTTSPLSHPRIACSATSTPIVPSFEYEDEGENYETEKKPTAPQNEEDNLTFTESFIDMQFDFLDRDDSNKPIEPAFTSQNEPDDNIISKSERRELATDSLQYFEFEHSVDQRQEGSGEPDLVWRMTHEIGSSLTGLSPIVESGITTDAVATENTDNSSSELVEDVSQYMRFEHSAVEKPQDLSVLPVAMNSGPEVESIINCDAQDTSLQFSNDSTLYTHFQHSAAEKPQDLSVLHEMSPTNSSDNSANEHSNGISTESLKSSHNSSDASQYTRFEKSALGKPQELSISNHSSTDSISSESLSNKQTVFSQIKDTQKSLEKSSSDVSPYSNFERSAGKKAQNEKMSEDIDFEKHLQHETVSTICNEISPIVGIADVSVNTSLLRLSDVSQLFLNCERMAADEHQDSSHILKESITDSKTSAHCSTKVENVTSHETPSINLDLSHIREDKSSPSNPPIYEKFAISAMLKPQDSKDFGDAPGDDKENLETIVTCSMDDSPYVNFDSSILERPQDLSVPSEKNNIAPSTNSIGIRAEDDFSNCIYSCIDSDEIVATRDFDIDHAPSSHTDKEIIDIKFEKKELEESSENSSNEISLYGNFEHSASNKPQDLSNLSEGAIDIVKCRSKIDDQQNITSTGCDLSHIEKTEDVEYSSVPSAVDPSVELDSSDSRSHSDNDMSRYSNFEKSAIKKTDGFNITSSPEANQIVDAEKYEPVSPIPDVESPSQMNSVVPRANKIVDETPEYANFDCLVKDKPQDLSDFSNVERGEGNNSSIHRGAKKSDEGEDLHAAESDINQPLQMAPSSAQVEVVQSRSPTHAFSPADIVFTGPASDGIMSTSFNQESDSADADVYSCNAAPETLNEWDSGSDDSHNSSSSGEFIWKEGEGEASLYSTSLTDNHSDQRQAATCAPAELTTIEEECRSISSSSCSDDERSDEEVEFVPSSWDCKAEPTKSSLRSLEVNQPDKKKVVFKRQKYHCVYEYPREVTDSEGDSMHSPFLPDYSTYSDWELMGLQDPCRANYDHLLNDFPNFPMDNLYQLLDTSSLSNMATPDEDFFISSSTRPFESLGIMTTSSQFFPGRRAGFKDMDVNMTADDVINGETIEVVPDPAFDMFSKSNDEINGESNQEPKMNSVDFITPDSGMEDVTPGSALEYDINTENGNKTKTNSTPAPVIPYWDKQINRNRHFRTLMLPSTGTSSSESQTPTSPLTSSSSESPLSPQTLGGLRHTRDKLKLDLPPSPLNMHSPSILSGRYSNKDLKVFDFRNIDFNNLSKRDLVEKSNKLRNREETPSDAECENEHEHENMSDNATTSSEDAIDSNSVSSSDLPLNNENVITDVMVPTPTFSTFGKEKAMKGNSPDKFIFTEDESATEDIVNIVQKADSDTTDSCLSQQSSPHSSQSELLQKSVLPVQVGEVDNKAAIEPVKGEGTLLDSGDEDSGIESSARTTLERNIDAGKVSN